MGVGRGWCCHRWVVVVANEVGSKVVGGALLSRIRVAESNLVVWVLLAPFEAVLNMMLVTIHVMT